MLFANRKRFFYFVNYQNEHYRSGHDQALYRDVIDFHRKNENLDSILNQNSFYDLTLETLRSWDMDKQGAELTSVDNFRESVQCLRSELNEMYRYKLYNINRRTTIEQIAGPLKKIFCELKVMKTKTKIVGVSKAMHFLLPDLIMPVDRRYILTFFHLTSINSKFCEKEFKTFYEIIWKTFEIKRDLCLQKEDVDGLGWKTSVPKLIDNAIIGFLRYLYSNGIESMQAKLTEVDHSV